VDDYQWLENFDDAAVKEWNQAQNKASRAYLDSLPARTQVAERLRQPLLRDVGQLLHLAVPARRGLCDEIQAAGPATVVGGLALAR